jgi:TonB-linked SusC/RagA family outer membrane protein
MARFNHANSCRITGRWMNTTLAILLSAGLHGYCQETGHLQNGGLITLTGKNLSLVDIKQMIKDQTGIIINFNEDVEREAKTYNPDLRNVGIDSCLRVLLADKWLECKKVNSTYLILIKEGRDPGRHILEGMVRNGEGEALAGATVTLDRIHRTTQTDAEGRFRLTDTVSAATAEISYTGYFTRQVLIVERSFPVIELDHNVHSLDGVVIEAYGRTTHRLETGDIAQLNSGDIEKQPVGNLLATLEGRLPGLAVTQSSGVPGSSFNVQVRGQNSIFQGNQPLILIDGVPIPPNNNSLSDLQSGSAYGLPGMSPLGCFNPGDIDNIEVLKDAEATAIYGSRGANGVLLITTKKGRPGPMTLSAGFSFGGSRAINTPHLMNTRQYLTMREEAMVNDSMTPNTGNAPDLVVFDTTRYTDYKKMATGNTDLFQDGMLSVSGGDDIFTYLLSGDEHRESTPFPGGRGELRLSSFAALGYHSRDKKLQVQNSSFYSTVDNHLPILDPTQFIYLAPNTPSPYDKTGKFSWQSDSVPFLNIPAQGLNTYHGFTKTLFTHWQVDYHLLPGLTARASLGYNSVATTETGLEPIVAQDPATFPTGSLFLGNTNFTGLIGEPQLEYAWKKGPAKWDLLVGATLEDQHSRHSTFTGQGYSSDSFLSMPDKAPIQSSQDSSVLYLYEAMFLRAKLDLADKYLFSLSARRDGSSRFGPGHQYGNFGSVGAAWIFSKERSFPANTVLSFGKLRGSYGITGNDQIGDYEYAQSWSTSPTAPYGGIQGVYPATPGNALLGWESVHKLEGALELGAWQDRVFFSAAWYRDWTGNQLLYNLLPSQTGYVGVTANLPVVVENKGWEFLLRSQQQVGKLSWNSSLSLTIPSNRLLSFPGLASSGYAGKLAVGKSVNVLRGYQYTGVDRDSGIYRFRDVNGDGQIDNNDLVFGGNTDLRAYAGWNNEIGYKGWQLTVFIEARSQQGRDALVQLFNQTPLFTATSPGMYVPVSLLDNMPVEVLQRWQRQGDDQPFQKFTASPGTPAANALNNYVLSNALLRDASFIRLKTLMLSYSLPKGFLSRRHMRSCLVYVQAQNLLTLTHYPVTDPETQNPNALPPLRTMAAGIQFNL